MTIGIDDHHQPYQDRPDEARWTDQWLPESLTAQATVVKEAVLLIWFDLTTFRAAVVLKVKKGYLKTRPVDRTPRPYDFAHQIANGAGPGHIARSGQQELQAH